LASKESDEVWSVVDEILMRIPKPNYDELPQLYLELDIMASRVGRALMQCNFFDRASMLVRFDKASGDELLDLILRDLDSMIPFFVTVCGFSMRELERLYGIKDIYSLRKKRDPKKAGHLVTAIKDNLRHPLQLETLLYKFYKNWEEHQKRHKRGRQSEEFVVKLLKEFGYDAGKLKVSREGVEREIDCAVPPDYQNLRVAIMVRYGVFRDLDKRAKEFSAEFDELLEIFPHVKFVVVYPVSPHEMSRIEKIRKKIEGERIGKTRPYDLVVLTYKDLIDTLPRKLKEWIQ
jgi:hypothetical protein